MMIKCLVIGKDRCITEIKINPRKSNFTHNRGLYTIPKEAVNIAEHSNRKVEAYPELIFWEGNPLPVNLTEGNVQTFLGETVLSNALKQTSRSPSDFMAVVYDYMRNPPKLVMLLFIGIIAVAAIGSFL